VLGHNQPIKALAQRRLVEHFVGDALALNLFLIRRKRHRRGAEIKVLLERIPRGGPALLAQRVTDRERIVAGRGAHRLYETQLRRVREQRLDDAARQLHSLRQLADRAQRFDVHQLEHQIEQVARQNSGFRHR
jgi:hypothetical protein